MAKIYTLSYLKMLLGYSSDDIHHLFAAKWKSEVHTGLLLPFDVSISITLGMLPTAAGIVKN